MASNPGPHKRIVSPGPGGCIPIVGALYSFFIRRRRVDPEQDDNRDDDRA